jgi:hypothetical protein
MRVERRDSELGTIAFPKTGWQMATRNPPSAASGLHFSGNQL